MSAIYAARRFGRAATSAQRELLTCRTERPDGDVWGVAFTPSPSDLCCLFVVNGGGGRASAPPYSLMVEVLGVWGGVGVRDGVGCKGWCTISTVIGD